MTDEARRTTRTATWEAPGPGSWVADRSHGLPGPTPVFRRLASEHTYRTYWDAFRETGAPAASVDVKLVNGQMYRRVVPLVGARFEGKRPPPAVIVKILTRLHPAFRREERQAAQTLSTKPYLESIQAWNDGQRQHWIDENRTLQRVEVCGLDDAGLADHLDDLDDLLVRGWYMHHRLHAYDLGPIGDLMAHAQRWGLDTVETMSLLQGASPATVEAADHARAIANALRAGGIDPTTVQSIDTVRSVPAASEALDTYLDTFGWRVAGGYDIDAPVLHELPAAICGMVRAAQTNTQDEQAQAAAHARLRERCPDPDLFDELVADARAGYGVRDDNGPLTSQWPTGLTRRAYLEAARRLTDTGRLNETDHVFELDVAELAAMLRTTDEGPSPSDIADRAALRSWERSQRGPDYLGALPVEPDLSPLPPSLRRIMEMIIAATSLLEPEAGGADENLRGLGIGDQAYRGRACVAIDASDAVERLEPGDVLVTPFTSPSFNSVLPMAGAIVIQEGGLLCHAAVMARELDIPAVVGCTDAMDSIADGALVEVDPGEGCVRLL